MLLLIEQRLDTILLGIEQDTFFSTLSDKGWSCEKLTRGEPDVIRYSCMKGRAKLYLTYSKSRKDVRGQIHCDSVEDLAQCLDAMYERYN